MRKAPLTSVTQSAASEAVKQPEMRTPGTMPLASKKTRPFKKKAPIPSVRMAKGQVKMPRRPQTITFSSETKKANASADRKRSTRMPGRNRATISTLAAERTS